MGRPWLWSWGKDGRSQRQRSGAPTGLVMTGQGVGQGNVNHSRSNAAESHLATEHVDLPLTWWLEESAISLFFTRPFKWFNWVGMMNANRTKSSPWNIVSQWQYHSYIHELNLKNTQISEDLYHSIRLKLMLKTYYLTHREQRQLFTNRNFRIQTRFLWALGNRM